MKEIYCDSAATSKPNLKVLKRYYEFAKKYWANPSSLYFRGRAIKMALEECRERCAKQLDCDADEIYFTSGGTESNNMVLNNFINKDSIIFYSPIEHPSIMEILKKNGQKNKNFQNLQIPLSLEPQGFAGFEKWDKIGVLSQDDRPKLLILMLVNNETGVIQPVIETIKYFKSVLPDIFVHVDGVQAVGKMPISLKQLGADSFSTSLHKNGGIRGCSVFFLKKESRKKFNFSPLLLGGGQENGLRSGTENFPAIAANTYALECVNKDLEKKLNRLCEFDKKFIDTLLKEIPEAKLNVTIPNKVAGVHSICFQGINAQSLLLFLDMRNISVSAGSACHSGSDTPSYVLKAMGLTDEEALSTLRFSFNEPLTDKQLKYLIQALKDGILQQLENE